MVKMEDEEDPNEPDPVLGVQRLQFPVDIPDRVLKESGDVLEGSPLLSHVSGLPGGEHELGKVAIGLLGQRSTQIGKS